MQKKMVEDLEREKKELQQRELELRKANIDQLKDNDTLKIKIAKKEEKINDYGTKNETIKQKHLKLMKKRDYINQELQGNEEAIK